jgi:hypothetical protein
MKKLLLLLFCLMVCQVVIGANKNDKPLGYDLFLSVQENGNEYVVDKTGKLLPCFGNDINSITDKFRVFSIEKPVDFYPNDKTMWPKYWKEKIIIDQKLMVQKNDKFGIIDLKGNWLIPCEYEYLSDRGDLVYYITKDGKKGLLEKTTGKEILTDFESIQPFCGGLAAVSRGKKKGYIDYTGKLVIPLKKLYAAGYFIEGEALVTTGNVYFHEGKCWWIDSSGKEVKNSKRYLYGGSEVLGYLHQVHREYLMIINDKENYYLLISRLTGKIESSNKDVVLNKAMDTSELLEHDEKVKNDKLEQEKRWKEDDERMKKLLEDAEKNRPKKLCTACDGTGKAAGSKETCGFCSGGSNSCGTCGGDGWSSANARCYACDGTGRKRCTYCNGKGIITNNDGPDCEACGGTGKR